MCASHRRGLFDPLTHTHDTHSRTHASQHVGNTRTHHRATAYAQMHAHSESRARADAAPGVRLVCAGCACVRVRAEPATASDRRNRTIRRWQRLTHALRVIPPTGHNISQGDDNSMEGESTTGRNPSSTGLGCYRQYDHLIQSEQRQRHASQVRDGANGNPLAQMQNNGLC